MSWLIQTSLQLRLLVVVLAIALVIVGIRTADSVPLDVFPEFAPPLVEIQTEAPGHRHRRCRESDHGTDRERRQRNSLRADRAFQVGAGSVERAFDL